MDNLELEVQNILYSEERILNFYIAKKTKSAYFIIVKGENEFITFRVSNHPTNSFYSNRTFSSKNDLNQLLEDIRNYMDKSGWYVFKYEDYFCLKALSKIPYKLMKFYIDNTMGMFDFSLGGLIFYQSLEYGKKNKQFNAVSESFQKGLRKLFASGLISSYRESKDKILIYINRSGRFMMDYMEDRYIDRFKKDEKNINYKYIEVPDII